VEEIGMARIRLKLMDGRYCVKMFGCVTARDLRRLERLCGPALERPVVPLTLRLAPSSSVDVVAQTYLERLVRRGAVLIAE
jgi:hypothetical protein